MKVVATIPAIYGKPVRTCLFRDIILVVTNQYRVFDIKNGESHILAETPVDIAPERFS